MDTIDCKQIGIDGIAAVVAGGGSPQVKALCYHPAAAVLIFLNMSVISPDVFYSSINEINFTI